MAVKCFSIDGQAYTNELENKISRLEEENARLRREKVCFVSSSPDAIFLE